MEKNFLCPACRGHLNVSEEIIFIAKTQSGSNGLITLSSKLGDYKSCINPAIKIKKKEHVDFYCPLCHINLASYDDRKLVRIIMLDELKEYEIFFSGIAGEKLTYKVGNKIVQAFGEDSAKYDHKGPKV